MIQPTHTSRRILLPARAWYIYFSLLAASVLNMMPTGYLYGMPDWVALVLCFWCIHQPLKVGMAAGFIFGLVMDVADGSVMGQHAFAYVLLAYFAGGLSRRVLWFPLWQQALHVLPMLLGAQLAMLGMRLALGAEFPGMTYFLSSLVGALLWHPINYLLLLPQYRPAERDENRPI